MREFIFVFGREPELSYLEILSYFKTFNIIYKLINRKDKVCVFLLRDGLDFDSMINKLGGTVKIAEVFSQYEYDGIKDKINFGISVYSGEGSELRVYLEKEFKREKVKAMFRKPKDGKVFFPKEAASKRISEFVVFESYWGKVISYSNPRYYAERDEKRPKQDVLKQVSIRLARILVNLSGARNNVLDPFCGMGTILQESLLLGIDATGVDSDVSSVSSCKENLRWLEEKYEIKNKFKVIRGDSTRLSRHFKRNSFDGIVTEPYMGTYFKKIPRKEVVFKIGKELEKLYYEFFLQSEGMLKKNGKIAIVLPRLKYFGGKYNLDVDKMFKNCGLRVSVLDEKVRFPIVSEGRFLDRLVYVFEKSDGRRSRK